MKKDGKFLSSDKDIENSELNSEKKESKIKNILHSRKFARGWLFVAIIAVFLACVVAVNIIASVLEEKFPSLAFDITSSSMYELQEDTEKFCKSVDKDITMYILASEDRFVGLDNSYMDSNYQPVSYFSQANQFFKKIAGLNSHITLKYEDISSNPSFASKYSDLDLNNTGAGIMVVIDAGKGSYKGLEFNDLFETTTDETYQQTVMSGSKVEQAVCTAILSLTQKNTVNACFITSSGITSEADAQNGSSTYSALKKLLKNQAYNTTEVDLDTKKDIPDNCDILFLIAPSKDLSEKAMDKVEKFLDRAKKTSKTFVYVPNPFEVENGTPLLDTFLEQQGMKLSNEWVYEQDDSYLSSIYPDDHRLSIADYNNDDFTKGIDISSKILIGDTKPITFTEGSNATTLLDTSKDADLLPLDAESEDDIKDGGGKPMSVAGISKSEVSTGVYKNVVVVGSFYAVSDEFLNGYPQYNNSTYFTNIFNNLTENQGQTVAIKSASKSNTSLDLETSAQTLPPLIIFVFIVPIGVIITGIVIWAVRRKK